MWLGSPPASCSSIWVTHLGKQRWQKVVKIQRTSASSQPALLHLPESSWKFKVFWKVSIDQIFWWFKQSFILWTVYWKKTNYDYHQRYRLFFPILYLRPVCPSMLCAANASKSGAAIVSLLAKVETSVFFLQHHLLLSTKFADYALLTNMRCCTFRWAAAAADQKWRSEESVVRVAQTPISWRPAYYLQPTVQLCNMRLLYYAETFTKNQEHRRNL